MNGVFLQGGGALGAWQAGVLEVLSARGLTFQSVMGYSIGAVNGTALASGRLPEALERWRSLTGAALKPSPRLSPLALFSIQPLLDFLSEARDEEAVKAALIAELTIISACAAEGTPHNARFTPGGKEWDGPLMAHAAASCAIPLVFPPVDVHYRGKKRRLIDGGVPMPLPLDFSPLASCEKVLVLEMVRHDERGRRHWTPWRDIDQRAREAGRDLVDEGLHPLLRSHKPPVVHRLHPSRRLEPLMLDFRAAGIARMLAQGAADAEAYFASPEAYRVR